MPTSIIAASLGARTNRMTAQAMPITDIAQRDRDRGADDLLDDGGVDRDPAGDLGRAVLLEEAGARRSRLR